MGCAKITMALVLQRLFCGRLFEYTSYVLTLFTAFWTISGVLVTAFQCNLPTPWDLVRTNECVDILAFGNYLAATNIVTEILLVLVPLAIWTKNTPVGNRLFVSAVFWLRLRFVDPEASSQKILTCIVSSLPLGRSFISSTPPPSPLQLAMTGPSAYVCRSLKQFLLSAHACQGYILWLLKR